MGLGVLFRMYEIPEVHDELAESGLQIVRALSRTREATRLVLLPQISAAVQRPK